MSRLAHFIGASAFIWMTLHPQSAWAVNKCTAADGSVSFQHAPCPDNAMKTEKVVPRESSGGFEHPFARREGVRSDVDTIIRTKCAEDWPDDFRMRAYCEKKQYEGLQRLQEPPAAAPRAASVIREKCANDWPNDFSMRAYCERKQVEALQELGRR